MILQAYLQKWLNLTLDMHVVFPLVYRLIEMALLLRDDIGLEGTFNGVLELSERYANELILRRSRNHFRKRKIGKCTIVQFT